MKQYENLLKLILTGNPITILQEPEITGKFNELLKHDLIEITEEKIVLTQKGRDILNIPLFASPTQEQEIEEFGEKARIKGKTFYLLSLFLLMISILFVFAAHF
ncbi:hypothetical protein FHG64_17395 [Antarcticibacterium flavum]|uniref:Uncharacterized protein n=1 Tax=Antarcticibacterium flavum TaxID=2058175 RepID=A0A5B7X6I5_9FLAO|nr:MULTISPECIES: hypothetical protein [Antarcticibacterium]MCM4159261.1 hypothetical protein [Antarcticibacterium sp. W02-3]QCY71027.1 hypothetical protein FHG64_17395 [Antarcticibacterium flavum]